MGVRYLLHHLLPVALLVQCWVVHFLQTCSAPLCVCQVYIKRTSSTHSLCGRPLSLFPSIIIPKTNVFNYGVCYCCCDNRKWTTRWLTQLREDAYIAQWDRCRTRMKSASCWMSTVRHPSVFFSNCYHKNSNSKYRKTCWLFDSPYFNCCHVLSDANIA